MPARIWVFDSVTQNALYNFAPVVQQQQYNMMRGGATMLEKRVLTVVLLFLSLNQVVSGYRLLFLPLSERTHMLVHLKLATVLAARGHEVSVVVADCHQSFANQVVASMAPAANLHFIPYSLNCSYHEQEKAAARLLSPLGEVRAIYRNVVGRADDMLSDEALMEQLSALAPTTDVLISDIFSFGMLFAAKLDISHLDLDVGTAGSLWEPVLYGAEPATSYIPAVGSFLPTGGMSVWQRSLNLLLTSVIRALIRAAFWHPSSSFQHVARKHGIPVPWPYTHSMMVLVNSNFAIEPPRAVPPNIQYVGPILPEPAQALPHDLDQFVTGSGPAGTVIISFGGTLQAPLKVSQALVQVAAAMHPVRFVWKLSQVDQAVLKSTTNLSSLDNVYLSDWLPQNDLLGHPGVRAFVTQGGYLSMGEAAYHGVPVLGVPFIPGQAELIRFAADQGRARFILPRHLQQLQRGDTAVFVSSLEGLLGNSSYSVAAQVVSKRLKAAARPYKDTAADWVEFSAAVKGEGPFLHPVKVTQRWYQQSCLDVYACMAAAVLAVLFTAKAVQQRVVCVGAGVVRQSTAHCDGAQQAPTNSSRAANTRQKGHVSEAPTHAAAVTGRVSLRSVHKSAADIKMS